MSDPRPSRLKIEQLALGELPPTEAEAVHAALERTGQGDALARLEASDREILADYPPERVAADIRRKLAALEAEPTRDRAWWTFAVTAAAAVAIALILVLRADTNDRDDGRVAAGPDRAGDTGPREHGIDGDVDGGTGDGPDTTRIKGGVEAHVVIDRQTVDGHERLRDGELVEESDLLQISYVSAGRSHGVIFSIDGAGVVTLHHPRDPSLEPRLDAGEEVPLGHAYELDAAPGFERFVIVTRDDERPVIVPDVLDAAERVAAGERADVEPLKLPGAHWHQHSVVLRKPTRGPTEGHE